jgi:hypothetical protein
MNNYFLLLRTKCVKCKIHYRSFYARYSSFIHFIQDCSWHLAESVLVLVPVLMPMLMLTISKTMMVMNLDIYLE